MILYITIAVVTALLASLVDNHPERQSHTITRQQLCNRVCLTAIFLILFLLSACRLNVGNDYAKYVEFMHLVNCDAYVPTEIGFNLLVKLIYGLSGYENFLLVFAFYSFVTVLFFLLAMYEQSDEFGMTFFLFMTLGYYFQTFSTVRYYLALALALYSMKFVLRRTEKKAENDAVMEKMAACHGGRFLHHFFVPAGFLSETCGFSVSDL